jgi:hypothetical protein
MIHALGRYRCTMEDSILVTIKKMLGIDRDYTVFDTDILVHINTALMTLNQMGVGDGDPFFVTTGTETWSDFLPNINELEMVKTYIYLRVKILFDPPSSSAVLEAYNNQIKEFEWRLYVACEKYEEA